MTLKDTLQTVIFDEKVTVVQNTLCGVSWETRSAKDFLTDGEYKYFDNEVKTLTVGTGELIVYI
ncbi:hypothetical protein NNG48_07245 [Enterococcus faecium]|nr:hypothetical protein [Enterococcus faecium]